MAKTKKISVFDTKAYKAKLLRIERNREYNRKYIKKEYIRKNIFSLTNIKTHTIKYVSVVNQVRKKFKTLEEATEYNREILKNKKQRVEKKYIRIEKNIAQIQNIKNNIVYRVSVFINKQTIKKTFKTIEEAKEYKNLLIKRQKLIKRLKSSKNNISYFEKGFIKIQRIFKYIYKRQNTKTNHIYFLFKMQIKNIQFYKSFKTLDEAIAFRDNYLKEHT